MSSTRRRTARGLRVVRGLRGLVATCLVGFAAVAGVALSATPAEAAVCGSGSGVSVVVDFHELGGGVVSKCATDGGGTVASTLFTNAGFPLTYVQQQPGFVCRVSGAPASASCVKTPPSDAYWGLFWSDGTSGTWSYAALGVGSLTVPDGGSVAFSWQGSTTKAPPGVAPPKSATTAPASPTPPPPTTQSPTTPAPSGSGNGGGRQWRRRRVSGSGGNGGGGGNAAGGGTSPAQPGPSSATTDQSSSSSSGDGPTSSKPSRTPKSKSPTSAPPSASTDTTAPAAAAADGTGVSQVAATAPDDDGLPLWVPLALVALLGAAAGGVAWTRRSVSPSGGHSSGPGSGHRG